MATAKIRGAIRVGNRANSTQLLIKPAKTRKGLLLGSSFAGGALMALGATLTVPNPAMAACTTAPTLNVSCTGSTGTYTDTAPSGGDASITFAPGLSWNTTSNTQYFNYNGGTNADNRLEVQFQTDNSNPTMTLTNTGTGIGIQILSGVNGTIDVTRVDENVSVTSGNDALRLRTGAAGGTGTNALTGTGDISVISYGEFHATGSGQGIDAKAGSGGVDITVGEGGELTSVQSQGLAAEAGGSGVTWGDVNITINEGGLVAGGTQGTGATGSGVLGLIYGDGTSSDTSTGDIKVTNHGEVTGVDSTTGPTVLGTRGAVELVHEGTGSTSVINDGHIESTYASGVYVTGGGETYFENTSYYSVLGTDGFTAIGVGQATLENHGTTAGLARDGAHIDGVDGTGLDTNGDEITGEDYAVYVDNESGILAGGQNGISIANITGTHYNTITEDPEDGDAVDTLVYNAGSFSHWESEGYEPIWNPGGLIVGTEGDGIYFSNSSGSLTVDNRFTWETGLDLTDIDSQVYNEGGESGLIYDVVNDVDGPQFNNGIYGQDNGIYATGIATGVSVLNEDGRIVGAEGDGIAVFNSGDSVYIDNSATGVGYYGQADGGTIWGGEDGIRLSGIGSLDSSNAVTIDNEFGWVFGKENGIYATDVSGDVFINNEGGLVEGYWGDAINVATNNSEDKVGIVNGANYFNGSYYNEDSYYARGDIIAADTAINLNTGTAFVWNYTDGAVVGDGEDGAVMNFYTDDSSEGWGGGSFHGALVINDGLMTSQRNPNFERGYTSNIDVEEFAEYDLDTQAIYNDTDAIAEYAWTGGASGDVYDLSYGMTIQDYGATASDLLVTSEGGALVLANFDLGFSPLSLSESESSPHAVMFGRIVADGASESYDTESSSTDYIGNTVINFGQWFVTNASESEGGSTFAIRDLEAGTILDGINEDAIYNVGLIQTAFQTEGGDFTSFVVDDFVNGSEGGLFGYTSESNTQTAGLLSMIDDDPLDLTVIQGNFHGGDNEYSHSYLGVDVWFAPLSEGGQSDILQIGSESSMFEVTGSTGIIAHKLNDESDPFTQIGDRIPVVYAYTGDDPGDFTCEDEWCEEGDSFFVSELSPDYVKVGNVGFIRDGMFMWGLQETYAPNDPETDWVATWGPDAFDQPVVVSTLQTAWYDTAGLVEDHVYGNTYPNQGGGGGADLPGALSDAAPAPATSASQSAIWGRITGNWSSRDTSIDQSSPPLDIDTSLSQNTYSVVGGLEFRPNGGDSETRWGIFGGYLTSSVTFEDFGGKSKASGGLVGGYGAFIKGPWYIDAEVKADFLSVDYTSPSVDASTSGVTIGVLANTGYRFDNGKAFIEPIASFAYANTILGDTSGGGASIDYGNAQSIRAGVGARVGATFGAAGGTQTELDVLGKVWNEFGGGNSVTVSDGVNTTTFTDNINGVFGEVVGRATVYNADRSASGFVSIGGKFGSSATDVSAKAGIRKNF